MSIIVIIAIRFQELSYLPGMKFLQYGTGSSLGCSEVTKTTVSCLLDITFTLLFRSNPCKHSTGDQAYAQEKTAAVS